MFCYILRRYKWCSRRTRKHYSDGTKRAVYVMLLQGSKRGRLTDGLSLQVSLAMDVSLRCVQRIWNEGQKGRGTHGVVKKRAKNCGCKRIELNPEAITATPPEDRTTLADVARGRWDGQDDSSRAAKRRANRMALEFHQAL